MYSPHPLKDVEAYDVISIPCVLDTCTWLSSYYSRLLACLNAALNCFLSLFLFYFGHKQAIEKRISVFSQIPVENGELIQVLRWGSELFNIIVHK